MLTGIWRCSVLCPECSLCFRRVYLHHISSGVTSEWAPSPGQSKPSFIYFHCTSIPSRIWNVLWWLFAWLFGWCLSAPHGLVCIIQKSRVFLYLAHVSSPILGHIVHLTQILSKRYCIMHCHRTYLWLYLTLVVQYILRALMSTLRFFAIMSIMFINY